MSSDFVVGIDVAGRERGYQCAVLGMDDWDVRNIFKKHEPDEISETIKKEFGNCRSIAIDSPPKASIDSENTRLAERQLNKDGYNVQWTPRNKESKSPGGWMKTVNVSGVILKKNFQSTLFLRPSRLQLQKVYGERT